MNFTAYAAEFSGTCVGPADSNATDVATIGGIECVIGNLLGIIVPLIAIAGVIMIIYSGARMMLSADNPKEMEAAKKTLTFAIIGVVGIGLAWVILNLISTFTGAPEILELNVTTN